MVSRFIHLREHLRWDHGVKYVHDIYTSDDLFLGALEVLEMLSDDR